MNDLLKLAALTPFKARAIEAAAGGVVGAAGLGFLGAKTFKTEKPRLWLMGDQIYGRDLEPQERRDQAKRVLGAAAVGALLGGGGSMGVSTLRRRMATKGDLADATKLFNTYFGQLNREIGQQSRLVDRGKGSQEVLDRLKQISDEGPDRYVDWARRRRDHMPWGGPYGRPHVQGDTQMQIPSASLAEGQMIDRIGPNNIRFFVNEKHELRPVLRDRRFWTKYVGGGS